MLTPQEEPDSSSSEINADLLVSLQGPMNLLLCTMFARTFTFWLEIRSRLTTYAGSTASGYHLLFTAGCHRWVSLWRARQMAIHTARHSYPVNETVIGSKAGCATELRTACRNPWRAQGVASRTYRDCMLGNQSIRDAFESATKVTLAGV